MEERSAAEVLAEVPRVVVPTDGVGAGGSRRALVVLLTVATAVVVLVVGVVVGVVRSVQHSSLVVDEHSRVLTRDGLDDLVADLRDRTGSSEVFEAVLYPNYAYLEVPVGSSARYDRLYYDGSLDDSDDLHGTETGGRVDLADVDIDVVLRLVEQARAEVEDVTSTYVIVQGASSAGPGDDGVRLSAYASNDYSESSYVAARLDGTVVRTNISPAPRSGE